VIFRHLTTTNRPIMGRVALVRAAAMKSFGGCTSALHLGQPTSFQWLDRSEDLLHPGEASA
jgi:hypothetical protein